MCADRMGWQGEQGSDWASLLGCGSWEGLPSAGSCVGFPFPRAPGQQPHVCKNPRPSDGFLAGQEEKDPVLGPEASWHRG